MPGMARLGATVWTGDIDPTWGDLKGTPGLMLNWGLNHMCIYIYIYIYNNDNLCIHTY